MPSTRHMQVCHWDGSECHHFNRKETHMSTMLISVAALKAGDILLTDSGPGWTAEAYAITNPDGTVSCLVRHRDGGAEVRVWESSYKAVTVDRPEGDA